MIYNKDGSEASDYTITEAIKNWPELYTDTEQVTPVTLADLLSVRNDVRTASAETVQAMIDADEKISALAEPPVASVDGIDDQWVVVTFPTDATAPKFWSGVAGEVVAYGGQYTAAPYAVRQSVQKWQSHFDKISALL
tara:strand:+ start:2294 stop:2707 length:414 start_codon:yes stop_codon:yes gene_type:complete